MMEYEKKILLSQDEYSGLVLMFFKYRSIHTQTNHYFDTEELFMNKHGITCRIREKNGVFKTVIKNHSKKQPECSIEEELGERDSFYCNVFYALGMCYHGALVTDRMILYKEQYCEVVIDRNSYLGITDFELEVEYKKGYEDKAISYLKRIAETLVMIGALNNVDEFFLRMGKSKSKSQRFFERKLLK